MNVDKITTVLLEKRFLKIRNSSQRFEQGSTIYTKEIEDRIFLLFVVLKDKKPQDIHSFIARFDCLESIGKREPDSVMFYLLISTDEDLHYFEKYLSLCD